MYIAGQRIPYVWIHLFPSIYLLSVAAVLFVTLLETRWEVYLWISMCSIFGYLSVVNMHF